MDERLQNRVAKNEDEVLGAVRIGSNSWSQEISIRECVERKEYKEKNSGKEAERGKKFLKK